jgi:hypothetical protein
LHVVERDKEWAVLCKRAHDRKEREAQDGRGRSVRPPQEQRDLERRAALNRNQLPQRRFQHRREEIADGRECELGLGAGRARRQDADVALSREAKPLGPERGLADSCVALELQRLPARRGSPQECRDSSSSRLLMISPAIAPFPSRDRAGPTAPRRRLCDIRPAFWTPPEDLPIDALEESILARHAESQAAVS